MLKGTYHCCCLLSSGGLKQMEKNNSSHMFSKLTDISSNPCDRGLLLGKPLVLGFAGRVRVCLGCPVQVAWSCFEGWSRILQYRVEKTGNRYRVLVKNHDPYNRLKKETSNLVVAKGRLATGLRTFSQVWRQKVSPRYGT